MTLNEIAKFLEDVAIDANERAEANALRLASGGALSPEACEFWAERAATALRTKAALHEIDTYGQLVFHDKPQRERILYLWVRLQQMKEVQKAVGTGTLTFANVVEAAFQHWADWILIRRSK